MGNLSKFRGGHGPLALHVAMLLHGKLDVGHALVPSCLGAPILNLFYWTPLPSSFRCTKLGSGSLSLKPTYQIYPMRAMILCLWVSCLVKKLSLNEQRLAELTGGN